MGVVGPVKLRSSAVSTDGKLCMNRLKNSTNTPVLLSRACKLSSKPLPNDLPQNLKTLNSCCKASWPLSNDRRDLSYPRASTLHLLKAARLGRSCADSWTERVFNQR